MKPHGFKDFVRTAEYHLLTAERALADAAKHAPSVDRERFAVRQSENLGTLRQVLPALRAEQ